MNKKIKFVSYLGIVIIFFAISNFGYKYLKGSYLEEGIYKENSEKNNKGELKDFILYKEDGSKINIRDYIKEKPLVINFWASWCPPCKEEMPYFNEIKNTYGDKVEVLMVNLTDGQRETREKARLYIDKLNYDFNILYDEDLDASKKYSLNQIPRTLFVDKNGNVIKDKKGMFLNKEELNSYIDQIIK